jgi:O-antigen ligase
MGQSLPTFMDTDHVRFSIFLCGSFLLALVYMNKASFKNKMIIGALLLVIVFLSVRTAWVILFVILFFFFVGQEAKKISAVIKLLSIIGLMALTAYALFPTVRQKVAYTVYDWQQYKPGTYDSNYSDAARRAINYAAWQAVKHGDGANTGWAVVPATLQHYFTQYFSGATMQYGWPFNQYLFWWMGSGWWGMLLFSIWLLYPAVYGWKRRNPGLICWTVAIALSCLVECSLTLQYGVWLHAWVLGLFWLRAWSNVVRVEAKDDEIVIEGDRV